MKNCQSFEFYTEANVDKFKKEFMNLVGDPGGIIDGGECIVHVTDYYANFYKEIPSIVSSCGGNRKK